MKKNKWKWIISIFFLVLAPIFGVMHQIKGGGPQGSPSADALCPFGGLETLFSVVKNGTYISKIEPSSFVLLGIIIVLTVLFGRVFCGYICPLGTMQTLMNKLAKILHIKQIIVSVKVDKALRYVKYLVLFIVLFLTYKTGSLIIRPYDPWAAFMHLGSGAEIFSEFLFGVIILFLILISSLFIERAWCRYLCPLGAALSIISPISLFKVKRNNSSCINCKACTRNCPVGLEIHTKDKPSRTECIACGECVSKCPIPDTLQFKRKNTVLSLSKIAIMVTVIIIISMGTFIITGNFKTSSPNKEVLTQGGSLNPDNIKGYMTLNDVCKEFNVSSEKLLELLKLPKDTDLNKPMKDLSKELSSKSIEFDPEHVREIIKTIK